ncbi:MAG: ADP-ribosylglycohydrolase family protein [Candidatus Latescibacteria bacterium]|nr:ADP-ribosylglycohydrolase family protein [Candidatus Latescibacterota bacterium]
MVTRARACLLGQLAGDALGSLVEFQSPSEIRQSHPTGVRDLADGGTYNTIAGQPTDDSELALLLARLLIDLDRYDPTAALKAYVYWHNSDPFDVGHTIGNSLLGRLDPTSQSNGALMRISPLGIFGARHELDTPALARLASWADQDAALTHPHPVCRQANALYVMAIAWAVRHGGSPADLYARILDWSRELNVAPTLSSAIIGAADAPPPDYLHHQGWVLIALRNALWQLLHAPNLEEAVVDTVMRGGDTDTNAAICGALLGAVHGGDSVPSRWVDTILSCRPAAGDPHVHRPRPECFWPVDALELAERLVTSPPTP